MVLFSLPDSLIDLGSEILAAQNLGMPGTYRQTFSLLAEGGIIDKNTLRTLSVLVSYRNRLAHEYGETTPEDLVALLSYKEGIPRFVEKMKEVVRENQRDRALLSFRREWRGARHGFPKKPARDKAPFTTPCAHLLEGIPVQEGGYPCPIARLSSTFPVG
jgi:uncharacterized protein YutE (UPF0331/DUF86 family)